MMLNNILIKGFHRVFKSIFPIEDLNDKATLEYVSYNLKNQNLMLKNVLQEVLLIQLHLNVHLD